MFQIATLLPFGKWAARVWPSGEKRSACGNCGISNEPKGLGSERGGGVLSGSANRQCSLPVANWYTAIADFLSFVSAITARNLLSLETATGMKNAGEKERISLPVTRFCNRED